MTPAEAIQLAAEEYPRGPEAVAARLGAEVRREPLSKDGWCLRGPAKIIIKLNSNAPVTRQRFTLAHEVAHLVYGTKTDIADRGFEGYDAKGRVERQADALASQLLLPVRHLQPHVTTPVIDPATIRRVGKEATVSEQVVSLRLARLAGELGIGTAGVAAVGPDAGVRWKILHGLPLDDDTLLRFYQEARAASGRVYREYGRAGRVYTAAALYNVTSPTLFVQELPYDQAVTASKAEQLRAAGAALFEDDEPFRRSLEGKFGAFKPAAKGMTLKQAVDAFINRYWDKWGSEEDAAKFLSRDCRRYIRLKLAQWVPE